MREGEENSLIPDTPEGLSAGQEPHGEASDDDFRRIYRAEKERWAEVADRLK